MMCHSGATRSHVAAALLTFAALAPFAQADTVGGMFLYEQHCGSCHTYSGGEARTERAPNLVTLQSMSPTRIYQALSSGPMMPMAASLSDVQKRTIAESLSGRPLIDTSTGGAEEMPNRCPLTARSKRVSTDGPRWIGWGNGPSNSRFQPAEAGGLSAANIARLKLKWAFGFPGGISAYGQPTISGGRVYVGNDNAHVYSLDLRTGCVYWSFPAKAGVRTAPLIVEFGKRSTARAAVLFGDYRANVYAIDANNGKLLWERKVDEQPFARIIGSLAAAEGRVFVPMSSWEEIASQNAKYECCKDRGSVIALDAATGRTIWRGYVIPDDPQLINTNAAGTRQYGPAGAAVWLTPTVDLKRRRIYVGTADGKGALAPLQSDSIVALDMDSGHLDWWFQGTSGDSMGSGQFFDYDFGSSPILTHLDPHHRLLVAAQKSGVIHALDPDRDGTIVWQHRTSASDETLQFWRSDAVIWGPAIAEGVGYFGLVDGTMLALRISDGAVIWHSEPPPKNADSVLPDNMLPARWVGKQAAVTVVPGAVISGGVDGVLRAYSTIDGRVLWETPTAHEFETVNAVEAHGGTMSGPGAAVAGGMLIVNSGYGMLNGASGNVLLAFAVE